MKESKKYAKIILNKFDNRNSSKCSLVFNLFIVKKKKNIYKIKYLKES